VGIDYIVADETIRMQRAGAERAQGFPFAASSEWTNNDL
jgi:hypothetical protein